MTPSLETEISFGAVPMGKLQPRVQWLFAPLTKIAITIQKIDFFRYLAIYYYGGIYLDLDMDINVNFDQLYCKKLAGTDEIQLSIYLAEDTF